MIEIIPNQSRPKMEIAMPGSKSITNRVLLLAALAEGRSTLTNFLESEDTFYMQEALRKLGIQIENATNAITIRGGNGIFKNPNSELFLGNAGTATRFLAAALTLNDFPTIITGDKRMQARPIQDLINALNQLGAKITSTKNTGCPPISCQGPLKGGTCEVSGHISSQYLSALLIAAPYAQQDTLLKVTGTLVSQPYIDITLKCMKAFGIEIVHENYKSFFIPAHQHYRGCNFTIEGDASAASYFLGIAALNKRKITISNIGQNSAQGDLNFLDLLEKMGCQMEKTDHFISAQGPEKLNPLEEINLSDMPDAAMTAAILCAFTDGQNTLTGLHNLKVKECDRLTALATELQKIGAAAKETPDGLIIKGNCQQLHGAEIETYHDHRIAMCFAIAGTKIPGIKIRNPECTAKTYPHFWEDLRKIGIKLKTL